MFTAGHFWRKEKFTKIPPIIPHNKLFLDSGAFQLFGRFPDFPFSIENYANFVGELAPDFFATMDYPCELFMRKKIGFEIKDCIEKTVDNTVELMDETDGILRSQLVPVIQGWGVADYLDCVDLMRERGAIRNYMAVGTLCRRGKVSEILSILGKLQKTLPSWCRLHGFGVKISLLKHPETYQFLESCDSAAWVSRVAFGEICIFTGKKLLTLPYKDLKIDSWERLSISVEGYISYIEYLIEKNEGNRILSDFVVRRRE